MSIDAVNKWLTAIQSVAVILGVVVAMQTLKQTQQIASATLTLQLRDRLENSRYLKLANEIQDHDQNYPLLARAYGGRGGKFRDIDIEEYIGNFEDIGYLIDENMIDGEMAYHHFAYDVEKAWCNADVQHIVRAARKADKSVTAAADPLYGNLEKLAEAYLSKERQSCKDLNNQ
jgi:uncharacterized protein (DUF885 family)